MNTRTIGPRATIVLIAAVALCAARPVLAQAICSTPSTLQETFKLGSLDGPTQLNAVTDLELDRDGKIYLGEERTPQVVVFDSRGQPAGTIGRRGQGPGEFTGFPFRLGWHADTLWVMDFGATHFFTPDGKEAYQVRFRTPIPSEGSGFVPSIPLADGTFLGNRTIMGPTYAAFLNASSLPLLRFSQTGAVLDTIAWTAWPPRIKVGSGNELRIVDHPLYDWSSRAVGESLLPVAAAIDGASVILVGNVHQEAAAPSVSNLGGLLSKPAGTFDLLRIGIKGDTLVKATIAHPLKSISGGLKDWLLYAFAKNVAGDFAPASSGQPGTDDASKERRRAAAREALTFPEFLPPVREIVAGHDGSIWLLRELRDDHADLWEVYDDRGRLQNSVLIADGRSSQIPWLPRLKLLHVTRDEVWGMTLGDLDVPVIHRFRVKKACG